MSSSDEEPEPEQDMEELNILDDELERLLDEYYSTLQVSVFF